LPRPGPYGTWPALRGSRFPRQGLPAQCSFSVDPASGGRLVLGGRPGAATGFGGSSSTASGERLLACVRAAIIDAIADDPESGPWTLDARAGHRGWGRRGKASMTESTGPVTSWPAGPPIRSRAIPECCGRPVPGNGEASFRRAGRYECGFFPPVILSIPDQPGRGKSESVHCPNESTSPPRPIRRGDRHLLPSPGPHSALRRARPPLGGRRRTEFRDPDAFAHGRPKTHRCSAVHPPPRRARPSRIEA